jgi:hypothetical protein
VTKLMYAVVVFYCSNASECWTTRPFPDEFFDTRAECAETLPKRARDLLLPHFRQDHRDVSLRCDPYDVTLPGASGDHRPGG